jgi:ribose 5-phosphate isomerase A
MTASVDVDGMKRAAALRAVEEVEDGMVLGLGSGSTAGFALEALAARIARGLRVTGIPTSEKTTALARRLGIPLTTFDEHQRIDLTIDGADQVERGTLNLVKGLGGALLREKIVASASRHVIIVADETKLVNCLGRQTALPIEIVPFGWQTVLHRLAAIECAPQLRLSGGSPFVTDGGNYIVDCIFSDIHDAAGLEQQLAAISGVVETGLFIGLASAAMIGTPAGVTILRK